MDALNTSQTISDSKTMADSYRGSSSFNRCAITSCDGEADRANSKLLSLFNEPAAIIHNTAQQL